MYCIDCGTKNPDGARFCMECGMRMPVREALPAVADTGAAAESAPHDSPPSAAPRAVEEEASSAKDLILSAFRHFEGGRHEEARALCARAIALEPGNADAHALMSTLYEHAGDMVRAIEERERVLEIVPDSLADREKLNKLKQGEAQSQPRRIVTSRQAAPALLENPAFALGAAVVVFLVIALGGGGLVWLMNRPTPSHASAPPSAGQPPLGASAPIAPGGTAVASAAQQPPFPASAGQSAPAGASMPSAAPPVEEEADNAPQPNARRRNRSASDFTGLVPPASVSVSTPPLEDYRRQPGAAGEGGSSSTIILPDRDPWNGQPPLPATQGQGTTASPAPSTNTPAQRDPGRITIVVSQPGRSGSNPPSEEGARTEGGARDTANMDSRARRAIAEDLQTQGQYKRAAAEYKRALDGAGDEAAMIHMKIGLCYQRADERESAISHYNEAIRLFQRQIQSGKDVEAACRAIRSCEAGIRNLK